MDIKEILFKIQTGIVNKKQQHLKPNIVVVSKEIYYEISSGYYSDKSEPYPFFPMYSVMADPATDKIFGIPLAIIESSDKDYLEIF